MAAGVSVLSKLRVRNEPDAMLAEPMEAIHWMAYPSELPLWVMLAIQFNGETMLVGLVAM